MRRKELHIETNECNIQWIQWPITCHFVTCQLIGQYRSFRFFAGILVCSTLLQDILGNCRKPAHRAEICSRDSADGSEAPSSAASPEAWNALKMFVKLFRTFFIRTEKHTQTHNLEGETRHRFAPPKVLCVQRRVTSRAVMHLSSVFQKDIFSSPPPDPPWIPPLRVTLTPEIVFFWTKRELRGPVRSPWLGYCRRLAHLGCSLQILRFEEERIIL